MVIEAKGLGAGDSNIVLAQHNEGDGGHQHQREMFVFKPAEPFKDDSQLSAIDRSVNALSHVMNSRIAPSEEHKTAFKESIARADREGDLAPDVPSMKAKLEDWKKDNDPEKLEKEAIELDTKMKAALKAVDRDKQVELQFTLMMLQAGIARNPEEAKKLTDRVDEIVGSDPPFSQMQKELAEKVGRLDEADVLVAGIAVGQHQRGVTRAHYATALVAGADFLPPEQRPEALAEAKTVLTEAVEITPQLKTDPTIQQMAKKLGIDLKAK